MGKSVIRWRKTGGDIVHCVGNVLPERFNGTHLFFLGDIALAKEVGKKIEKKGSEYILSKVPTWLEGGGYVIFNLECCLTKRGVPWEPKPILMNGKDRYLKIFSKFSAKLVANVANNHFLDFGERGARDTISALQEYGVEYFGLTIDGTLKIQKMMTPDGIVGLIGLAPAAHSMPNTEKINLAKIEKQPFSQLIREVAGEVDITIVNLHQGVEYCSFVTRQARKLAINAVDAGADLVICHHAHVIQGIEYYKNVPIFHGLGNFLIEVDFCKYPDARYNIVPHLVINNGTIDYVGFDLFKISDDFQALLIGDSEFHNVKQLVEKTSFLLLSKHGQVYTYSIAMIARIRDRICAIFAMLKKDGLAATTKYYYGRIVSS